MPEEKDVIHTASVYLRTALGKLGKNVPSSQAHDLIAAYTGFRSKKALIDSTQFDLNDPDMVLSVEPDMGKLRDQVEKLRPDLLQQLPLQGIAQVIKQGLTPPCECCGYRLSTVHPITDPGSDSVDGWVCMRCVEKENDYATCTYCGDEITYRAHHINSAGECPEHAGESEMDPEEEVDYSDLAEYWQDR